MWIERLRRQRGLLAGAYVEINGKTIVNTKSVIDNIER